MMRGEALEKSMFFMSDPDWYYYLDEDDDEQFPLLTDKAPPEAVESYNYAKKLFEKTHNVWLAAFINTMLFTMITVANTVMFWNMINAS